MPAMAVGQRSYYRRPDASPASRLLQRGRDRWRARFNGYWLSGIKKPCADAGLFCGRWFCVVPGGLGPSPGNRRSRLAGEPVVSAYAFIADPPPSPASRLLQIGVYILLTGASRPAQSCRSALARDGGGSAKLLLAAPTPSPASRLLRRVRRAEIVGVPVQRLLAERHKKALRRCRAFWSQRSIP